IQTRRKTYQTAGGDEDFFGKPAIAIDAQKLAEEAERFVAASTEFALAAKEIGLDGDFIAGMPIVDVAADCKDAASDFAAQRARELNRDGEAGGFAPEIDVVEATALDLDDGFISSGNGIRDFAQFEFSGRAMGGELTG